jgi:2-hydroxy-6-oxonona-2,4-dienedioate hydrolase
MSMIRGVVIAVLLLVASGLLFVSCSPLDVFDVGKAEIESRLLALDKNAGARALGIERKSVAMSLGGERREVEVRYLRIAATAPGGASAPPLILVHGTPATLFTFSDVLFGGPGFASLPARLPDRDIYALEVIGHGIATAEAPPHDFARCAEFVAGFAEHVGSPRVDLAGNSYGGEFCLRVALDRPELVRRLVLLDSSGAHREDAEFLPEEVAMREHPLADLGWLANSRENVRGALQPHFRDPVDDDRVEEVFLVCENAVNWRAMIALARDENGTREPDLPRLEVETLVLWGDRDVAYPVDRFARRIAFAIPDARLEIIEDCGHYPQEERPERVIEALARFLAPP